MIERLEGTGWRVYKSTPRMFGVDEIDDEDCWVLIEKFDTEVSIRARCAENIPPAVALVLAAKLAEFAGGAK